MNLMNMYHITTHLRNQLEFYRIFHYAFTKYVFEFYLASECLQAEVNTSSLFCLSRMPERTIFSFRSRLCIHTHCTDSVKNTVFFCCFSLIYSVHISSSDCSRFDQNVFVTTNKIQQYKLLDSLYTEYVCNILNS